MSAFAVKCRLLTHARNEQGIDDVLAIIMMLLSPEVVVKAITLTHGNTTLQNVKRNAVTLMHVMQQHREFLGQKAPLQELPVLAVGNFY